MHANSLGRLLWKEYRVQRSFWLAVAVFAVLIQGFPWKLGAFPNPETFAAACFTIAVILSAVIALGSGATLFASEREDETLSFLQSLSVPPLAMTAAKFVFAALSTVGLFSFIAKCNSTRLGRRRLAGSSSFWPFHFLHWTTIAIACLAWGIFFSLLVERPLTAVVLAAVVTFGVPLLLGMTFTWLSGIDQHQSFTVGGKAQLICASVVLLLDGWLAR